MPFARTVLWTSVSTALVAGSAFAQDRSPADRDTSVVSDTTAAEAGDTTVTRLEPVEVIGSVLPTAAPEIGSGIPARISIVTGEEIDAGEPRLLTEALVAQPGISLYDDLGSPYKITLVTRGFTSSPVVGLPQGVSVFIDGVPVNEPDAGQVNFDLLPLEHVRRLELLSGTASLLGPNSLGGAVNLLTRRGGDEREAEGEVVAGSYDSYSVEASVNGSINRWGYYAGGGYSTEDGWRQLTEARQFNGFANVGRAGERSGFNLQLFGADSRAETAGSLPLSVFNVNPDSNLSAGDFEDIVGVHVAASGYTQVGAGRGSAVAYFRYSDAERFNVNQEDDPDVRSFSTNRTVGVNADWRFARTIGEGTFGLRVGAGGSSNNSEVTIFAERINPGLTTDVESPIRKLDAYSIADYSVGRVTLSGGLRYDYVRIPFRNLLEPDRDTTSTYHRMSPRGGVSVDVGRGVSLYVSAGQSFRAPALVELACADPEEPCPLPFALGDDPPLDPVVATTYEVGGQWAVGPALVTASAYRTDVRDEIILFPYAEENEPEGSTIDGYFGNIDETRREGIELGSQYVLPGGHSLFANYAYTRPTFQTEDVEIFSIREAEGGENEIEAGDRMPLVPDHTLSLGGRFTLPAGFQFGVNTRYIGERWLRGDEANEEEPLDGYWVSDLRLAYEIQGWEISGLLRNVFDEEYATFGTFNINQGAGDVLERFLTPGPPRSFYLILRRSIGGA